MRLIFLLLLSSVVIAEDFDSRVDLAKGYMQSEIGITYEDVFRRSTWDINSECFNTAASGDSGAVGYYQLVASVSKEGKASNVVVSPEHTYSLCVKKWVVAHQFPEPPEDSWPIYLVVDIQD